MNQTGYTIVTISSLNSTRSFPCSFFLSAALSFERSTARDATFADCKTQTGTPYGRTTYEATYGDLIPLGSTYTEATFGGETSTVDCSAWVSLNSIKTASFWKDPLHSQGLYFDNCANQPSTDLVTDRFSSGQVISSGTNTYTATGIESVTYPCSLYGSMLSVNAYTSAEALFSFMRSPQCTSWAHALQKNASVLNAYPSFQYNSVIHLAGHGGYYTCCGGCRLSASTVNVMYWPTAPAATGCTSSNATITSKATLPSINARGLFRARAEQGSALTSIPSFAFVDGSTLSVDGCSTP